LNTYILPANYVIVYRYFSIFVQFLIPPYVLLRHYLQPIIRVRITSDVFVQTLEPATLALEELVRRTVLDELALVHHDDFVEVEDRVELMGNRYEGVVGELGAEELLDVRVRCMVETV
jgi:hypothetical protein